MHRGNEFRYIEDRYLYIDSRRQSYRVQTAIATQDTWFSQCHLLKEKKISIIGTGMQNTPGYAARMFHTLYEKGINIQLITTSEIRITCIIEESKIREAVQALHKAFELEKT